MYVGLTESCHNDPYPVGRGTSRTGPALGPNRGSSYYRARYYDPTIGRFISEDPIRIKGGINFYRCVGNSPLNFTDAKGTSRIGVFFCHCELAGPREPLLGGLCLYNCDCDDGHVTRTVLFPMGGELGLKNMCGAKLSCPSEVLAVKITYPYLGFNFSVYGAYLAKP